MNQSKGLLYGLNDRPPFLITLFLAIQHILLYIPGTIIVPIIIANILGVGAAEKEMIVFVSVLVSGISSFIQVYKVGKIGSGYMLFMGSSGAFMAASISAGFVGGFSLIASMTILSAPLEILFSYFMRFVRKIITPAMGGIVIILVVISIMPILMEMWTGQEGTPEYCSSENLIIGLVTIAVIIFFSLLGNSNLRLWSPVLGIIAGVLTASLMGKADFSSLQQLPIVGLPRGNWITPDFNFNLSHLPIFLSFLFATLASTIETIGDSITIQDTSTDNFRKVKYEVVQGSLYADGVGNILAGLMGTVANTTYSGNIAVIRLTGVASRKVGIFGSVIIFLLAFFPKITYSITLIPNPVLGSSTLVLMGLLFASGIKLIATSELDFASGIIIGASLTVGILTTFKLFFPPLIPDALKPLFENSIATGGMTAIILNVILKLKPKKKAHIRLPYDISELKDLHSLISSLNTDFNLTPQQYGKLQLSCEEIFAYLITSNPKQKGMIHFNFSLEEDFVQVVVEDKSEITDVDLVEDSEILETRQKELGLLLVNKIAKKVEHVRINGYNTISFQI